MTGSITIRRCEPLRDVDVLLQLYEVVFGRKIDRPFWDWKHRLHPAGKAVSFVAENICGRVVAHFAHLPWRMRVAGRELIACQGVDFMVHPEYRRQGVGCELVTACRQEMIEREWHFSFGFPGHASLHLGLKKLGYIHLLTLPYVILQPRGLASVVQIARTVRTRFFRFENSALPATPKTTRVREIRAFDERVHLLSRQTSGKEAVATVRDAEFLNWRFFRHPTNRYTVFSAEAENELQGYCAVHGSEIIDLQVVDTPEVASCLVAHAVRHIRQQGSDVVGSRFSSHSPGHRILRDAGFIDSRLSIPRRGLGSRKPVIVLPNPTSPVKETMLDPRGWVLNMGDADCF